MAYSEELDIIQNMKNLSVEVSNSLSKLSEVKPSLDELNDLKNQFQNLESSTIEVINRYSDDMKNNQSEYERLLSDARSQFNQVTNDVEALVNLEVDFEDIKDKIEKCLEINDNIFDATTGLKIMMTSDNIVPVSERKPYKTYYEII